MYVRSYKEQQKENIRLSYESMAMGEMGTMPSTIVLYYRAELFAVKNTVGH